MSRAAPLSPTSQGAILTFVVLGKPAPQGSKRAMVNPRTGKAFMKEQTAERLHPWRADVKAAAEDATEAWARDEGQPWHPLEGPVTLRLVVWFARPASHFGTGRNAAVLKPAAPAAPATRNYGDVEKHSRAVEDALTAAGVWQDDSQVCSLDVVKAWTTGDVLPGARVTIIGATA